MQIAKLLQPHKRHYIESMLHVSYFSMMYVQAKQNIFTVFAKTKQSTPLSDQSLTKLKKILTFTNIQTKFVNKLVDVMKKLLQCIDSGGQQAQ